MGSCSSAFKTWYISFSSLQMVTRQTNARNILTDSTTLPVTLRVTVQHHWWQQYETTRSSHVITAVQQDHNKLYPNESPLATRHSANDNTQNWFYPALPNKHSNTNIYTHTQTRVLTRGFLGNQSKQQQHSCRNPRRHVLDQPSNISSLSHSLSKIYRACHQYCVLSFTCKQAVTKWTQ
jgi:hypothetical protein